MMKVSKILKVVSSVVVGLSLIGVSAPITQAADFTAPKLGVAEDAPTSPVAKKGDKIFVTVKDTKNQKVTVYNKNAKKTSKKVAMGTTWTVKNAKKVNGKRIYQIKKSQWLNSKDVVKD